MIILPIQVLPPYLYSRKWYVHCIYADVLHAFEDNTTNGDCYLWVQMGLKRPGWQSQPFPVHRPLYTQRLFLSYGCSCADMVVDLDSASETWGHPEAQKTPPSHIHTVLPYCCSQPGLPAACFQLPAAWPHCLKWGFRASLMGFLLPSLLEVASLQLTIQRSDLESWGHPSFTHVQPSGAL